MEPQEMHRRDPEVFQECPQCLRATSSVMDGGGWGFFFGFRQQRCCFVMVLQVGINKQYIVTITTIVIMIIICFCIYIYIIFIRLYIYRAIIFGILDHNYCIFIYKCIIYIFRNTKLGILGIYHQPQTDPWAAHGWLNLQLFKLIFSLAKNSLVKSSFTPSPLVRPAGCESSPLQNCHSRRFLGHHCCACHWVARWLNLCCVVNIGIS
jgi:hypothetical protein